LHLLADRARCSNDLVRVIAIVVLASWPGL